MVREEPGKRAKTVLYLSVIHKYLFWKTVRIPWFSNVNSSKSYENILCKN